MRRTTVQLWLWCLVLFAAFATPPSARAQGAPEEAASPAADPVEAASASADPVEVASAEDKAAAREEFKAAKAALAEGKLELALRGFRASHAIVPSPNSHMMVVNTLVKLERHVDAYWEAQALIATTDKLGAAGVTKYQPVGEAARSSQEWLLSYVGLVTVIVVVSDLDAKLTVNKREVPTADWGKPVAAEPGMVAVALVTKTGQARRELKVAAGARETLNIGPPEAAPEPEPTPQPEPEPDEGFSFNPLDGSDDQRLTAYIVGGVGAASTLMFAIFGGLHLSKYSDIEDQCPNNQCPPGIQDDIDTGKSYQTGANVTLVIGLLGLAGGAALFFTTDWFLGGDEDEDPAEPAAWRPTITVGPGTIGISGTF